MIDIKTATSRTVTEPAMDADIADVTESIASRATAVWRSAMEVADAQISIWSLQAVRVAVLAAFGVVSSIAGVGLVIYGFFLLDYCLAFALSQPPLPIWVAPLVRGFLYCGLPMIGFLVAWSKLVGFTTLKK